VPFLLNEQHFAHLYSTSENKKIKHVFTFLDKANTHQNDQGDPSQQQ